MTDIPAFTESPARIDEMVVSIIPRQQETAQQAVARSMALYHAMNSLIKQTFVEGVHYGTYPGITKPDLLQPGIESAMSLLGVREEFDELEVVRQYDADTPFFYFEVQARVIHIGSNLEVARGVGVCHSREKVFQRSENRTCPVCNAATIMRSKYPPRNKPQAEKGWYCNAKNGGCGTDFDYADPRIQEQETGNRFDAQYIWDSVNNIRKKAKKRALSDAVKRLAMLSDKFTVDPGDDESPEHSPSSRFTSPPYEPETGHKPASNGVNTPVWYTPDAITLLLNWAHNKGYISDRTEARVFALTRTETWGDFTDGRDACQRIEAAYQRRTWATDDIVPTLIQWAFDTHLVDTTERVSAEIALWNSVEDVTGWDWFKDAEDAKTQLAANRWNIRREGALLTKLIERALERGYIEPPSDQSEGEQALLSLIAAENWNAYTSRESAAQAIKQAGDALLQELAQQAAKPEANTPQKPDASQAESNRQESVASSPAPEFGLSEKAKQELADWIPANFAGHDLASVSAALEDDFSSYTKLESAKQPIIARAIAECWPVIVNSMAYTKSGASNYLNFHSAIGSMRHYSRNQFVDDYLGDDYEEADKIRNLGIGDTLFVEEKLVLYWKVPTRKDGLASDYNLVTDAMPANAYIPF